MSLTGAYVWLSYNPAATDPWIGANNAKSWLIRTPADTELLIAEALKASPVDPNKTANANAIRDLRRTLSDKGVRVRISERVTPGAAGLWDPNRTEIRILPKAVQKGLPALAEILAHEAAHVAQSCRGGGIRKASIPLGIEVAPVEEFAKQLSADLYAGHPATRTIELEAFTAGARPNDAAKLVQHYCRGF